MLEIKNLDVIFNQNTGSDDPSIVLNDINLTFTKKGTINLIAGESGSGKSMLAKTMVGISHKFKNVHISGSIAFDGVQYQDRDLADLSKTIGFLPQYPADYVLNQVVIDEISFPLENLGMTKQDIDMGVFRILTQLGIENLQNRVVSELSSGELQKVALATALAPQPSFLILDEPFSRIDSTSALNLIKTLVDLKEKNITLIVFEHHLDYFLEVSDRLIILEKGKIIADGDPEIICHKLGKNLEPELMKVICNGQIKKTFILDNLFRQISDKLGIKA